MSPLIKIHGLMEKWSPAPSVTQIITETSSRRSILIKEVSQCYSQIINFVAVCAFDAFLKNFFMKIKYNKYPFEMVLLSKSLDCLDALLLFIIV